MDRTEIVSVGVCQIHMVQNRSHRRTLDNFRGYMQRVELFI